MYESVLGFPVGRLRRFDSVQRHFDDLFNNLTQSPASLRSVAAGAYPAIQVGTTPTSIEVHAHAPGIDAGKVDVQLERGVLMIRGERGATGDAELGGNAQAQAHTRERAHGSFRRSINLPEDIDPTQVSATYRDGVLRISIARTAPATPRRIEVQ